MVMIVSIAIAMTVWLEGAHPFTAAAWGILSSGVLIIALNRFFFPTRFSIDEGGITARFPLRSIRYEWADVRRFVHDEYGGCFYRRARQSRLDACSGLTISFGSQKQAVIDCINTHISMENL